MKDILSIQKRLEKLGVVAVYLFGSRAQGFECPDSDFDIGILMETPSLHKKNSAVDLYQELYELLSDFYQTMSDIDIVFLQEATGQLRYHVVKEGKVLFDLKPKIRQCFEEHTILEHADFEPYRRLFEKQLFTSIP